MLNTIITAFSNITDKCNYATTSKILYHCYARKSETYFCILEKNTFVEPANWTISTSVQKFLDKEI